MQAMNFAFDKAVSNGKSNMILWAFAKNTDAIKFYDKCGYVADGATKIYNWDINEMYQNEEENIMPNLVIILGPHAVGKMTVGQELEKITGYKLFHNHMTIELIRKFFSVHRSEEGRHLSEVFRREIFETVAKSDLSGLIFTYMFAFDMQSEYDYIQKLIDLYKSYGAKTCVVELCADFDVRIERNKTENRLANKESKRDIEHSEAEMRSTSAKYRLNSYDGENLPFENYMKIDNTELSPEIVAQIICDKFNLKE